MQVYHSVLRRSQHELTFLSVNLPLLPPPQSLPPSPPPPSPVTSVSSPRQPQEAHFSLEGLIGWFGIWNTTTSIVQGINPDGRWPVTDTSRAAEANTGSLMPGHASAAAKQKLYQQQKH
ncbi:hypothetical protein E2C01_043894 [Portunus trituberculatus]|uniref:Uncharacterized protein n=1 Tax=Portunus trituberculatus TaxID=210409 RepID=A0A5B7FU39_PORTR|nr:hypothetical protein [Portunus trituberculatus]